MKIKLKKKVAKLAHRQFDRAHCLRCKIEQLILREAEYDREGWKILNAAAVAAGWPDGAVIRKRTEFNENKRTLEILG